MLSAGSAGDREGTLRTTLRPGRLMTATVRIGVNQSLVRAEPRP
jgi:hypothetical protein